jgi:hypothetical protein
MSKVMFNIFLLSLVMLLQTEAQDDDLFNYIGTDEANRNFGPEDWDQVGCDNVGVCVSLCSEHGIGGDARLFQPGLTCRHLSSDRLARTMVNWPSMGTIPQRLSLVPKG